MQDLGIVQIPRLTLRSPCYWLLQLLGAALRTLTTTLDRTGMHALSLCLLTDWLTICCQVLYFLLLMPHSIHFVPFSWAEFSG